MYYTPHSLVAIIRTKNGTVGVDAGAITLADFDGEDVRTSVPVAAKRPSIRMELDQSAGGASVEVSYLCRGITWSPSYLIDVSDPKTARLTAKAVVINESVDLHNVQLDLVTGFPNIQFGEVSSPVAMSQNLEGFLTALSTGRSETADRRHMLRQQAVLSNAARFENLTNVPVPGYSTAQEGAVSEDLFLYPVEIVTLGRGETAYIPLFTAEIPYEHIYIWKIPDMFDEHDQNRREPGSDEVRRMAV